MSAPSPNITMNWNRARPFTPDSGRHPSSPHRPQLDRDVMYCSTSASSISPLVFAAASLVAASLVITHASSCLVLLSSTSGAYGLTRAMNGAGAHPWSALSGHDGRRWVWFAFSANPQSAPAVIARRSRPVRFDVPRCGPGRRPARRSRSSGLGSRPDHDLVDVDFRWLLDRERDRASDGIRWNCHSIALLQQLLAHLSVTDRLHELRCDESW